MDDAGTKRSWIAALAIAALGCLAPFALAAVPPSADLPQHLAQIRLFDELVGLAPASPMRAEPIAINWLGPGNLIYLPMWLAARAFGPIATGKIVLALLALLEVAAIFWVARARRRSPWQALLASVFAFNASLYWGFVGFLLGAPLFLVFVHAVSRLPRARPGAPRIAGLALLCLAMYGAHSLWFLAAAVWLAIATAAARPAAGSILARALAIAPAIALAAIWFPRLAALREASGYDLGARWATSAAERLHPSWLVDAALGGLRGPIEPAVLLIVVVWIAIALLSNRRALAAGVDRPLACAAALLLLAAYLGPDKYMNTIHAGARFAPTALVLLLLGLPAPRLGALFAAAIPAAVAVAFFGITAAAWRAFAASELDGLERSLAAMGRPGRIVGLDFAKRSELIKGSPFLQLAAWAQARNGSVPAFSFAQHGSSIVTYTRRRICPWTHNLEWFAEDVRRSDLAQFDFALVTGPEPLQRAFAATFGARPLTDGGRVRLYAVGAALGPPAWEGAAPGSTGAAQGSTGAAPGSTGAASGAPTQ